MNEIEPGPFNPTVTPPQKQPSKILQIAIFIIVAILVIGGIAYYITGGSIFPALQMNNTATTTGQVFENKEYVKLSQVNANVATFVFAEPVNKNDLIGANIKQCAISTSVGAEIDERQPLCTEITSANKFLLEYNEDTRTLTISGPNQGTGIGQGPFELTCASCYLTIEFNGIHTPDGQLLPKTMITTEYYNNPLNNNADWKTYRNEEYGFEFQYPSEAQLESAQASVRWTGTLVWPDGSSISLGASERGKFPRINTNSCILFNVGDTTVDGKTVEKVENADCLSGDVAENSRASGLSFIIPVSNNEELYINASDYGKILSQAKKDRILSILSTFKFIN